MSTPCSHCNGIGYRIEPAGEVARAHVCVCQSECATCRGARFVLRIEGGYEVAAPCDCVALRERVRLFSEAGIPAGYAHKSTSDFHDLSNASLAAAKQQFMRYQKASELDTRGVVLVGPPGVGKTHLICALLNYATLQRGIACRFIDFFTLTSRIRETYNKQQRDAETEASLIEPLVSVPILAIDDLGKGRGSSWELTIIDQLITRRYNARRIVIGTSNYFPEGRNPNAGHADGQYPDPSRRRDQREPLEERIGDRLFSRLVEMADVVVMQGDDRRQTPIPPARRGRAGPRPARNR